MKRLACLFLAAAVLVCFASSSFAAMDGKGNPIQGKDVTLTGLLSCTFCNLSKMGNVCEPGCCERCVKAGDPPLFTAEDGNQYILLTGEKGVPLMNPERYKLVSGMVTVKGVMIQGKGIQVIYVDQIEKKAEQKTEAK